MTIPNSILLGEVAELLCSGRHVVLKTKGESMRPFIKGDRDSVELVRKDSYEVGDIVLAQIAPGRYVLHRLIEVTEPVKLKGDGNLDAVETCRAADICGFACRILRNGERTVDCCTPGFARVSRLWRNSPRLFRRIVLGVARRIG